jgi:hypothetical protein
MQPSLLSRFQPAPSPKEAIPYSSAAMRQDLQRVRNAWEDVQASRDRNAIYAYLTAVYGLVAVWTAEGREIDRARRALCLQRLAGRLVRRGHSVHRRADQGRQANSEQMEPRHALRGGVQVGFRAAGSVRQAQGRHQCMCCAFHSVARERYEVAETFGMCTRRRPAEGL